jgi:DNA-binding response OmpR family regulator
MSGLTAIRLQKEPVTIGELTIEPLKRKVTLANRKVELTPREFDLLYLFMTNPGRS